MEKRMFINTNFFDECWKSMGLKDEDLRDLQNYLLQNPAVGDMIENTGGVRKVRWNLGTGKSHGGRVIYIDFERYERLFCLMAYPKNIKEDLTSQDKREIKSLVNYLKTELGKL